MFLPPKYWNYSHALLCPALLWLISNAICFFSRLELSLNSTKQREKYTSSKPSEISVGHWDDSIRYSLVVLGFFRLLFLFCSAGYWTRGPTQANTVPVGCAMPSPRLGSMRFETGSSCGALIARSSSSPASSRVQTLGWYFSLLDGAAGGLTVLSVCVLIHSGHLLWNLFWGC